MNNRRAKILSKLATLDTEKINRYLSKYSGNLREEIQKSKNNDQKFENLELLKQIIYQAPTKALSIIKETINTKNPLKPKKRTIHGLTVVGKSHDDLILKCIELLDKIRYLKTKDVFNLLIKLSKNPKDSVQKNADEVLRNLCQYNLFVMKKAGYYIQASVLAEIKKWSSKKILSHSNVLLEISNEFLRPSFEGHSMTDYKTFTLRHGPLAVNKDLINIRKDTISLLKKVFTLMSDLALKKNILQVLNEATRTPTRGEYKDDMKQMVLSNTNDLIDFYIKIVPDSEYEIISTIEEQSHWFTRKFGNVGMPKIGKLKKLIAANSDYQMFRVFVGYDRNYLEERDWEKAKQLRKDKIQEYITDISDGNFKEWQKRILSVIKNYSSSQLGEYQYFSNIFLRGLGQQKPSIAFELIKQNEKELEPFLLLLIAGIWEGNSSDIAKALVSQWIDSNKHLAVCASVFDYVKEIDKGLMESCFKKSRMSKDVNALNRLVDSIYPKHRELKSLFVQCIKELTLNKNTYWVNNIYRPESILNSLTEKDYEVILENLILVSRVDYHVETVLLPVAEKYPKKVIYFFLSKRVAEKTKRKNDYGYDAIPFDLHKINESLQKHAKVVVSEIIKWYSKETGRFEWEASHLIQAIFPAFNKELETELIRLIKSEKEKNAKIVISILRAYKGEPFIHNVCKSFIKHSPYVEKFKNSLFITLSQTGVVSGECGFTNAYRQKLEEVQPWEKDRNKAVKAFINEYEDYLNKQIVFEQKRADEDIELRKREYGSPEE